MQYKQNKKWVVNKKIRLCVCMCIAHIIIKDQELLKATKKESQHIYNHLR